MIRVNTLTHRDITVTKWVLKIQYSQPHNCLYIDVGVSEATPTVVVVSEARKVGTVTASVMSCNLVKRFSDVYKTKA